MMREIVWVIFDEIHYMQDRDRGVVWEETIITLPRACRMAFLSATLANAYEFATWVAKLHAQPCHVVYTEFRPTPLEHFALPCTEGSEGGRKGGLYRLCTADGARRLRASSKLNASYHKLAHSHKLLAVQTACNARACLSSASLHCRL